MGTSAHRVSGHREEVSAAFMQNHRGAVCIAFADPSYVRAERILVDRTERNIYAMLHESAHFLGQVSEAMVDAFSTNGEVLLTAVRPDGTVFELQAPVQIGQ